MNFTEASKGKARIPVPRNAENLMELVTTSTNIPVGERDLETPEGLERHQRILQIRSALSAAFYGKKPDSVLDPEIAELAADLLHEHNLLPRITVAYATRALGLRSTKNVQALINKLMGLDQVQGNTMELA